MADLERHAARIAELMQHFESSADAETRAKLFELLEHIDHLHRTCVWRLFERVAELGGKGLIDRVAADAAVKTLFVLYDLIPSEPLRPVASSALVTGPHSGDFIPVESLRLRGQPPQWRVTFARSDLPSGSLQAIEVDGTPVLLCGVEEGVFAYRNSCGGILPLHLGTLVGGEIHCPWHGCRFDVRTGKRLDGGGPDLESFPLEVRDDMIHVAAQPSA